MWRVSGGQGPEAEVLSINSSVSATHSEPTFLYKEGLT